MDIEILNLFLILWKYKITFVSLILIGLIFGLAISYKQAPLYMTNISVILAPPYSPSFLLSSTKFQILLAQNDQSKKATYKLKTETPHSLKLEIRSPSSDLQLEAEMLLKQIIKEDMERQKVLAEEKVESVKRYLMLEKNKSEITSSENSSNIFFSNTAIAQISVDNTLKELGLVFSPTIKIQPNFLMASFLGMLAGILLAGCWMGLSHFVGLYKRKIS